MNSRLWDILSIIGLVSICCLVVVFAQIAMDPNSPLNPFPPPTMPAMIELPTSTATFRSLPPTWTATPKETRIIRPPRPSPHPNRLGNAHIYIYANEHTHKDEHPHCDKNPH